MYLVVDKSVLTRGKLSRTRKQKFRKYNFSNGMGNDEETYPLFIGEKGGYIC